MSNVFALIDDFPTALVHALARFFICETALFVRSNRTTWARHKDEVVIWAEVTKFALSDYNNGWDFFRAMRYSRLDRNRSTSSRVVARCGHVSAFLTT